MPVTIRPCTPADYAACIAIWNELFADYPETVEEWRYHEAHREPQCRHGRWVAERDGVIVGYGDYEQFPRMYHPRKFSVLIVVRRAEQGQGIGAALYTTITEALESYDPLSIRSRTREDLPRAIRFLRDRGFTADMWTWESWLDVQAFDPAPFAAAAANLEADGITITTFRALAADPERNRKLYDLNNELARDVPAPEARTDGTFEHFEANVINAPNFLPDGFFVALDGAAYVGVSNLWASQASDDLYVGLTAVKRAYRRKGIASALKLRAMCYAKERGVRRMMTWNESNNRPILALNERMGFVRQPAWIDFVRVIDDEEPV